jgi:lipopolysaccharide export LptBFGC system permease protein LptF
MISQVSGQMGLVYKLHPLVVSLTPILVVLLLGILALRRI